MKVLIQNTRTLEFLKNERFEWTTDLSEAISFPCSLAAVDFFVRHQFPDAQLLLRFDEFSDGFDIYVPLLDREHLFATPAPAISERLWQAPAP